MSYIPQGPDYISTPMRSGNNQQWAPGGTRPVQTFRPAPMQQDQTPPQYFEEAANQGAFVPVNTEGLQEPAHPYLGDPLMANMAMHYGTKLVGTGKDMVDKEIEKFVAISKLKYYFSVDTSYVLSKLKLLLLPFFHSDWSLKYSQSSPLQPRFDVNAPDLYIPAMAYVTYVLVAGYVLGTQNHFSPEVLGMLASQALAWVVVEIIIQEIALYVINMQTNLKALDLLAFSGYKFVGIIISVLVSLLLGQEGYFLTLGYSSLTLAFFLVRTLKFQILGEKDPASLDGQYSSPSKSVYSYNNKRRMYFVVSVAICQPFLMWWMSQHLVPHRSLVNN